MAEGNQNTSIILQVPLGHASSWFTSAKDRSMAEGNLENLVPLSHGSIYGRSMSEGNQNTSMILQVPFGHGSSWFPSAMGRSMAENLGPLSHGSIYGRSMSKGNQNTSILQVHFWFDAFVGQPPTFF